MRPAQSDRAALEALPSLADDETLARLIGHLMEPPGDDDHSETERRADVLCVLEGLEATARPGALNLIEPLLTYEPVKIQAAEAMVRLARKIQRHATADAQAALEIVLERCPDERIRKQAAELLRHIDRFADHITAWQIAGPYRRGGVVGGELFDVSFPPEQDTKDGEPSAVVVEWHRAPPRNDPAQPWLVDINRIFPGNHQAAYLRTRVWSSQAGMARLELGSDDGVKVWLNRGLVHAHNAVRATLPGQDRVEVNLRQGWNDLLLKVTQVEGGWAVCARFRNPDGTRIENSRAEPAKN